MDFGKRPGRLLDRGDPGAWDWDKDDFTTDAQWHDLDCSSIVPAGATHVLFRVQMALQESGAVIQLRKKGNQNSYNVAIAREIFGTLTQETQLIAGCDSNQIVEYNVSNTLIYTLNVLILGYFTK